jgi:hypothetical protein
MTETTPKPLTEAEAEALMEAASAAIALPIPAPCRTGTIANIVAASTAAAFVLAFPLGDTDEPAPVFRA